jgi:hypothetical protein
MSEDTSASETCAALAEIGAEVEGGTGETLLRGEPTGCFVLGERRFEFMASIN